MKELEKGVRIRIRLIGVVFVLGFALVTMRALISRSCKHRSGTNVLNGSIRK